MHFLAKPSPKTNHQSIVGIHFRFHLSCEKVVSCHDSEHFKRKRFSLQKHHYRQKYSFPSTLKCFQNYMEEVYNLVFSMTAIF